MKAIVTLLVLGLMPGTALARVNWYGTITTKSASSACTADGHGVGETFVAAFLPSSIDTNGSNTSISMNLTHNVYAATVAGRPGSGAKAYDAVGVNSAGGHFSFQGSASAFSFTPANFDASTPIITMSGKFTNFFEDVGCTMTFDGAFVLRR